MSIKDRSMYTASPNSSTWRVQHENGRGTGTDTVPDEIDVGQLVFINVQNSEYGLVSSIDWNYNVAKVKVRDGTEAPTLLACSFP